MGTSREGWDTQCTPTIDKDSINQIALDWWHNELPIQDLYSDFGWVNLGWKYYPNRPHYYHLTTLEVRHIWEQEVGLVKE